MKILNDGKSAAKSENLKNNKQLHIIVDGCKVKLNFPSQSEASTLTDVKRMMLGGVPARGNVTIP